MTQEFGDVVPQEVHWTTSVLHTVIEALESAHPGEGELRLAEMVKNLVQTKKAKLKNQAKLKTQAKIKHIKSAKSSKGKVKKFAPKKVAKPKGPKTTAKKGAKKQTVIKNRRVGPVRFVRTKKNVIPKKKGIKKTFLAPDMETLEVRRPAMIHPTAVVARPLGHSLLSQFLGKKV